MGSSVYPGLTQWAINAAASTCAALQAIANKVHDNYRGIRITGSQAQVMSNYAKANGSDTGIANANSHNYLDAGTSTMANINSWQ